MFSYYTGRNGESYSSEEEWEYVSGPAVPRTCTPGVRDEKNAGKTPQQFMDQVNKKIEAHYKVFFLKRKLRRTIRFFFLEKKIEAHYIASAVFAHIRTYISLYI